VKSGRVLLGLTTVSVVGLAVVVAGHFATDPSADKHLSTVHAERQREEPTLDVALGESENPIRSGQLSILQALDASVLEVMNDKAMSNERKFTYFWDGYQKNKSSVALSTYYIDCLSSIVPLPHVELLLTELDSTMIAAKIKNHLMQVLQSAYLAESGMSEDGKQRILSDIKSNIYNVDPDVAGEAVLLYARMGAPDNLVAILGDALQRKIISPLNFLREGTFQLPNVNEPKQQNALVETLINIAQKSGSDESEHMLTTSLGLIIQSPSRLARIDSASKELIAQYLATHEPVVQSDGVNYGLISAIDYGNWLTSYAIIKSKSASDVSQWITHQVTDATADPKKIVAVMTLPMASEVVRLARESGQLEAMKHKVESEMSGMRPGTSAYSAFEAALELLQAGSGSDFQPLYP